MTSKRRGEGGGGTLLPFSFRSLAPILLRIQTAVQLFRWTRINDDLDELRQPRGPPEFARRLAGEEGGGLRNGNKMTRKGTADEDGSVY